MLGAVGAGRAATPAFRNWSIFASASLCRGSLSGTARSDLDRRVDLSLRRRAPARGRRGPLRPASACRGGRTRGAGTPRSPSIRPAPARPASAVPRKNHQAPAAISDEDDERRPGGERAGRAAPGDGRRSRDGLLRDGRGASSGTTTASVRPGSRLPSPSSAYDGRVTGASISVRRNSESPLAAAGAPGAASAASIWFRYERAVASCSEMGEDVEELGACRLQIPRVVELHPFRREERPPFAPSRPASRGPRRSVARPLRSKGR